MNRPARLIGGPFDGDVGMLVWEGAAEDIPVNVWAFGCGDRHCPIRVHWVLKQENVPEGMRGVRYDLEEGHEDDDILPYLYGELADPVDLAALGERAPVLA